MAVASKALRRTYPHLENSRGLMPEGDTSCADWPMTSETSSKGCALLWFRYHEQAESSAAGVQSESEEFA
jgi:hypothetical protein